MKNHYSCFYKKKFPFKYLLLAFVFVFFESCNKDDNSIETTPIAEEFDSQVVTDWYALIKTLTTETPGYTPPVASRSFGYTGVALYEAVQHGIPNKSSLSGKLNGLTINVAYDDTEEYHWPTVANTVLAEMTKYFYANTAPERLGAITALEEQYTTLHQASISANVFNRSVALANATTEKIILWSTTDGGFEGQFHNFPTDYVPPQGPGYWQPTAPGYLPALQPYWGSNRPFLTANIENTTPALPPTYSTDVNSICYERAMEVYEVVENITPEQTKIAQFWSDDPVTTATPPGHSISILNQLLIENDSNLAISAEAFAKLGIGIADAFISCWKVKYETNYPRPITYINEHIDPNWAPILSTPPFPEYTSGHSVQSGTLAVILSDFFGSNFPFTDRTHEHRTDIDGTPRSYRNFQEMAEEAAISRLYGGIHYHEAIYLGLEQGYQIGANINNLNLNQ